MYIIFANDLAEHCQSAGKSVTYADDSNFLVNDTDLDNAISKANAVSREIGYWADANGLLLNSAKSRIVKFLPKNVSVDSSVLVRSDKVSIEQVECVKFLGIYIDNKLTWEKHVSVLSSRLSSICFLVRSLRGTVSTSVMRMVYMGLFNSHLLYGLIFWGSSSYSRDIFLIQKRCLRIMDNAKYTEHCKPIFKKYAILPMPCLYIFQLSIFIRIKNVTLQRVGDVSDYNLRNKNSIYQPYSRLSVCQNSPYYRGALIYNKLPNIVKESTSLAIFKSKLFEFLINHLFYSVEEFMNYADIAM